MCAVSHRIFPHFFPVRSAEPSSCMKTASRWDMNIPFVVGINFTSGRFYRISGAAAPIQACCPAAGQTSHIKRRILRSDIRFHILIRSGAKIILITIAKIGNRQDKRCMTAIPALHVVHECKFHPGSCKQPPQKLFLPTAYSWPLEGCCSIRCPQAFNLSISNLL